ncbi:hypothetical protein ACP70R_032483 [Stipagrostis hirtigluma subsp. patula]
MFQGWKNSKRRSGSEPSSFKGPIGPRQKAIAFEVASGDKDTDIYSRTRRESIHRTLRGLSDQQKKLVHEIGFSSFLGIPEIFFFDYAFDTWILRNMSAGDSTLKLFDGASVALEDHSVGQVFGISHNGLSIDISKHATSVGLQQYIRKNLSFDSTDDNILEHCEKILNIDYGDRMTENQKDSFAIAFVAYIVYTFLVPGDILLGAGAPFFSALLCRETIALHNWSAYVRNNIIKSVALLNKSEVDGKKIVMSPQVFPFLQVFYCDNVIFDVCDINYKIKPRMCAYPDKKISLLINDDYLPGDEPRNDCFFGRKG